MFKIHFFILGLLLPAIVGCETTDTQYNKNLDLDNKLRTKKYSSQQRAGKSLMLPPDLLESSNETVSENYTNNQKESQQRVLPEVIGAKIVSEGTNRWLEIEADAQHVWDRIMDYWAQEQVTLVKFNPAAGIMATEWIEDTVIVGNGSSRVKNLIKEMFNRITGHGIAYDKYLIRLERVGVNLTRVYISHQATVKKEREAHSLKKLTNFEWVQIEDNPEKVAELLQLIVLLFDTSSLYAS